MLRVRLAVVNSWELEHAGPHAHLSGVFLGGGRTWLGENTRPIATCSLLLRTLEEHQYTQLEDAARETTVAESANAEVSSSQKYSSLARMHA